MPRSARLRAACVCALAQWALALAIQIGNYYGRRLLAGGLPQSPAAFFTVFPLIQGQNALAAACFGAAAYFAAANRVTAWIFFAIYCLESVYLLLDQVYYRIFLDHIRLGAFEGGRDVNLTILLGSFLKELNWIFFCSAAFAFLAAAWFARALFARPAGSPPSARPGLPAGFGYLAGLAVAFILLGSPAYSSKQYAHINENAAVELARELRRPSLSSVLPRSAHPGNLVASYRSDQPSDDDPRLAALAAAGASRGPRPNVVLIVLESVGSVNLLGPDGLPIAALAPNLASLARSGVVFSSLYTPFPGTTRSLVSLHTGGRHPTYGGVEDFDPRYPGPTLSRSFAGSGYDTAYFSSERMDGEATDHFLKQIDFAKYYDFSEESGSRQALYQIHSWGAREDYTVGLIEDWITHARHPGQPFLLEYMTTATHHPYGVPPGFPPPFPRRDLHSDYMNALRYTDHAIGALVAFLRENGLLDNTILVVTGDHGESFGERHPDNQLHKNFTYDENVREFLLVHDGRRPAGPSLTSARVGSNGDILPTLLDLAGAPPAAVPGRSLLAAHFESHPVFFHKNASPETWGLRDGRWKYIGEIRSGAAELYDLSADPAEQRNLAAAQPDRIARYRDLCREWYLASEEAFTGGPQAVETGDALLGARSLTVGSWDPALVCTPAPSGGYACRSGTYLGKSTFSPRDPVLAIARWVLAPDYTVTFEWVSPAGKVLAAPPAPGGELHSTNGTFPGRLPMEPGTWSVRLREKDQVRLITRFNVR